MRDFQIKNMQLELELEIGDFPLLKDVEIKDLDILIFQIQSFYEKSLQKVRSPKNGTRRKSRK